MRVAMTTAMILAAGFGTRLRPLTDELPKPLVPVGDRPMLAHVADRLLAGGVRRAVVNAHHLASAFTAAVLEALPIDVEVIREATILGTAGGVAHAASALGEGDVIAWNGDILAAVDVAALLAAHRAGGFVATLAVAPVAAGEGTVGLGRDGEVVRLRGRRFGEEVRAADFVGVQVLGAELRRALPAEGCLVGDVHLPALGRGARIGSFDVAGPFDDIGSIDAYLDANLAWVRRRGGSWVAPGALVAPGVELVDCVVGAGARVGGSGRLERAVVWPGAVAAAPLADVVVTRTGRVVPRPRG
jgi:mannose-1-phosphate guanylyltransferase